MEEEEGLMVLGARGTHQGMNRKPRTVNPRWRPHAGNGCECRVGVEDTARGAMRSPS